MSKHETSATNTAAVSAAPMVVALLADCRQLIDEAKQSAAVAVNASLTLMYWHIGKRIRAEILGGERAEYGKEILPTLSMALVSKYGHSFEEKNLRRMLQFAELFTDREIVVTLTRQLSWSHFLALLPLKDALQRQFYIEMCVLSTGACVH